MIRTLIAMNHRRGLLRLWVIASVLWIAFTGWLYASEIATALQAPLLLRRSNSEGCAGPRRG